MNSHTQKVAAVGFIGLAIFSAVVLFFPLAYRLLPESLQGSDVFQLAYALVAVCWMLAVFLAAVNAMKDTSDRLWSEYYASLPKNENEGGEGGDGGDDDEDGEDGEDDAIHDDTEVFESEPSDEPTDEEVQSAINSLATTDSGFVRADEIKQNPKQTGIQVFRVPGGTLKPGM